jgi:hypothetical protein
MLNDRPAFPCYLKLKNRTSLFFVLIFLQLLSSCTNSHAEKIAIDKKLYLTKTERSFAFSSTVIDLEFFERRSILPDKSLGNIFIHWEGPISVSVQHDTIPKSYNVVVTHGSTILLDTAVDIREEFKMDIKPNIK